MADVNETPLLEPLLGGRISDTPISLLSTDSADTSSSEAQQQSCSDEDDETDLLMQLFGIPYITSCQFWRKFAANMMMGFIIGCVTAAFFTLINLFKIGPVRNNTVLSEHDYYYLALGSSSTGNLFMFLVMSLKAAFSCINHVISEIPSFSF